MLPLILTASFVGSVLGLLGGVFLLYREVWIKKISLTLVSFAIGGLLGAAFLDLLPEALDKASSGVVLASTLFGILIFFIFEKFLRWYHCHNLENCDRHIFSGAIIFRDGAHNFIDEVALSASFLAGGAHLGFFTAFAIFLHEIPQEIGDFAILLHIGYSRKKVFFYNFLGALATIVGSLLGYFFLPVFSGSLGYVLGFTAGGFIYIASSDLIPEVHRGTRSNDLIHIAAIAMGIILVYLGKVIFPE